MGGSIGGQTRVNREVLDLVSIAYWERETDLLNAGLSLIFAYFSPNRGFFRLGHKVIPRLLKGRVSWYIEIEPLGVGLTRLPVEMGLSLEQGGRFLSLFVARKFPLSFDYSSEEEAEAFGAPNVFMSYYKSYTQGGILPFLGPDIETRIRRGFPDLWVAVIRKEGNKEEIPWLLWDPLGGVSSLLPSKL